MLVEKLSTEIPTITRYADLVHKVKDKDGKTYIFQLEFQAQITESAFEEDQGYFKSVFLGEEVLTFRYKVIKLWELSASELPKNKIMGLYPLLGLFRSHFVLTPSTFLWNAEGNGWGA